jgi:hypothetical protein
VNVEEIEEESNAASTTAEETLIEEEVKSKDIIATLLVEKEISEEEVSEILYVEDDAPLRKRREAEEDITNNYTLEIDKLFEPLAFESSPQSHYHPTPYPLIDLSFPPPSVSTSPIIPPSHIDIISPSSPTLLSKHLPTCVPSLIAPFPSLLISPSPSPVPTSYMPPLPQLPTISLSSFPERDSKKRPTTWIDEKVYKVYKEEKDEKVYKEEKEEKDEKDEKAYKEEKGEKDEKAYKEEKDEKDEKVYKEEKEEPKRVTKIGKSYLGKKEDQICAAHKLFRSAKLQRKKMGIRKEYIPDCAEGLEPIDANKVAFRRIRHDMLFNSMKLLKESYLSFRSMLDAIPRSNSEVIALVAHVFRLDLSLADDPISEYNLIRVSPYSYFPIDKQLLSRFESPNLEVDGLYLDKRFNPELPINYYDKEMLTQLLKMEGIAVHNPISPYMSSDSSSAINDDNLPDVTVLGREEDMFTALQNLYLIDTFHHGKSYQMINNETIVNLTEISDLDYDDVVLYGVRGQPMRAYTYEELLETFEYNENLTDPADNKKMFSDDDANKLINLCNRLVEKGDNAQRALNRNQNNKYSHRQSREARRGNSVGGGAAAIGRGEVGRNLRDCIEKIQLFQRELGPSWRKLFDAYQNGGPELKSMIVPTIESIRDMAMTMRGWNGEGPYPVKKAPVLDSATVDFHSNRTIGLVELWCQRLDDVTTGTTWSGLGNSIMLLPLFEFKEGKYIKLRRTEHGTTIKGRIHLVKGGSSVDATASCIRLSSNLFGATSHRYMVLLGIDPGFDVKELIFVS